MSGWRFRAGSGAESIGEPGSAEAGDRSASPRWAWRGPRDAILPVAVLLIAAILIGAGWVTREQHRPPRRTLPPAVHGSVVLVPLGPFAVDRLGDYPANYRAAYGLSMTIERGIPVPAAAWDASRRQYVAQDVLATLAGLRAALPDPTAVVIGVTGADLYIRDVPWRWAFGLRQGDGLAVISNAHMPNTRQVRGWDLFGKMTTREVGFLCFELPASDDPYDVLYRDITSVSDLQRVFDQL